MPIDWKSQQSYQRLLAALVAASDGNVSFICRECDRKAVPTMIWQVDYKKVAYFFGQGATYDSIEGRFRIAKKMATTLKAEAEEEGRALPATRSKGAITTPRKPRAKPDQQRELSCSLAHVTLAHPPQPPGPAASRKLRRRDAAQWRPRSSRSPRLPLRWAATTRRPATTLRAASTWTPLSILTTTASRAPHSTPESLASTARRSKAASLLINALVDRAYASLLHRVRKGGLRRLQRRS